MKKVVLQYWQLVKEEKTFTWWCIECGEPQQVAESTTIRDSPQPVDERTILPDSPQPNPDNDQQPESPLQELHASFNVSVLFEMPTVHNER